MGSAGVLPDGMLTRQSAALFLSRASRYIPPGYFGFWFFTDLVTVAGNGWSSGQSYDAHRLRSARTPGLKLLRTKRRDGQEKVATRVSIHVQNFGSLGIYSISGRR